MKRTLRKMTPILVTKAKRAPNKAHQIRRRTRKWLTRMKVAKK